MTPYEEYRGRYPEEAQVLLDRLRMLVLSVEPGAEEVISYGIPGFRFGKRTVHIGAFKRHVSLFVGHMAGNFSAELSGLKVSKGGVQFPFGSALPEEVLRRMVAAAFASPPTR